jgi:hypothetical protein
VSKCACGLITTLFFSICSPSLAQSYDYRQGYIFEQKYIKRISLKQAEQVAASPGLFNPFLSWDWGPEKISDSRIKRARGQLVLDFAGKSPLSLRDYSRKLTKQAEGDSQQFQYLKSVPGYHIIGVTFGHDQPAFLLVSESGRDLYFVDTY